MSLLSPWTPSTPSFRESPPSLDLSVYTPSIPSSPLSSRFPSPDQSFFPFRGRVLELALDKEGSRVLQRLVSDASPSILDLVFAELLADLPRVMCDTYGNYFAQQLFQVASLTNRVDCWSRLRSPSELPAPCTPSIFTADPVTPTSPTSPLSPRVLFATPRPTFISESLYSLSPLRTPSGSWKAPTGPAGESAFASVARDRRGTHSLQALISQGCDAAEFRAIAACLSTALVGALATDQHGTHVVQQVVEVVGSRSSLANAVFDEVVDNFRALAMSQFGLGLVKRCIGYADVRGYGAKIAAKLEQHLTVLVEDAFGNYAVQHALEVWSSRGADALSYGGVDLLKGGTLGGQGQLYASAKRMVQRISERVVAYSQHKFASNVAEMAIKVAEPQMRWKLISQFTVVRGEEEEFYGGLLRSPFAVFVVATALKNASDQRQARRLAEKFASYLGLASKTRAKWAKTLAPYLGEKKEEGSWFMPPEVSEPAALVGSSFYY